MRRKTKAILLKIYKEKPSKYGGTYIRTIWRDFWDNDKLIFDCQIEHYASRRFLPYLKKQAILSNLDIIETRMGVKYIDGKSDFKFHGIKTKENESNN